MDRTKLNVRSFLESAARECPAAPLLIWTGDGSETSYDEFNRRVDRAANAWHSLGVRKGDRVAFMLDNCPEFLYAWLGLAKIGGVLVAINTGFKTAEASYVVSHAEAGLALVGPEHLPVFSAVRTSAPSLRKILTLGHEDGFDDFREAMASADAVAPQVDLSGDDLVSLIYTSGTTGEPKGVMQTHGNFVLTGQAYPYWMRMQRGHRIYACLPLFHINSQAYSTMGAIGARGAIVLAPRFSASQFWADVRRHRVNVFNFIGAMTVILSKKDVSPDDADNEVHTAYGVPALPHDVRLRIEERFGLCVVSGFGMSETTFGLLEPPDGERRPGSMGVPRHHPDPSVPRTEASVVDQDGRDVSPGETGELVLRNVAMMRGYFRDPDRTASTLRDGWLHTGDNAWYDEDGYFYYVDREKDIVRRRGENISSVEVERAIEEHPGVLESAVVGVPSDVTDEDVLAYVVQRAGYEAMPSDLLEWCAERLADFKVPRYIEFIDELPKTQTSKIQKSKLRELRADSSARRFDSEAAPRVS